jgi:hypothetical protein
MVLRPTGEHMRCLRQDLRCSLASSLKELENTETTRVVTINPGGTRTQMRAQAKPAENPNTLPNPDQVAEVFSFGLTPQADSFHGQRIYARDVMAALGTWPASDSTR